MQIFHKIMQKFRILTNDFSKMTCNFATIKSIEKWGNLVALLLLKALQALQNPPYLLAQARASCVVPD